MSILLVINFTLFRPSLYVSVYIIYPVNIRVCLFCVVWLVSLLVT